MGGLEQGNFVSDASDVFREVDEEVRREQLKKLWDRYGIYLVILAVLIVARSPPGAATMVGGQEGGGSR